MSQKTYKRATQDVGNMLCMEHVNFLVPNQQTATDFYLGGLGFTRDPYMMVDTNNMWVNVGEQQFHLPTRGTQVLRGHVGLVVPNLKDLKTRLASAKKRLAKTKFAYSVKKDHVAVTGPWGNQFRCYAPAARFGGMTLGIPYVEFVVKAGTAAGIGRFYEKVINAPVAMSKKGDAAHVRVGNTQELIFRETKGKVPKYDGHHIAVYVSNFSGPHKFLEKRGLVTEETNDFQYRFEDIVDPDTGKKLFKIEHEVRSLYHPMFGRERNFVNRNAGQNLQAYSRGRDAYVA